VSASSPRRWPDRGRGGVVGGHHVHLVAAGEAVHERALGVQAVPLKTVMNDAGSTPDTVAKKLF